MADFLFSIRELTVDYLKNTRDTWEKVLERAGIKEIKEYTSENKNRAFWGNTVLIKDDNTYYSCRLHQFEIDDLKSDWEDFIKLGENTRKIIIEALFEMKGKPLFVRYHKSDFYKNERVDKFIQHFGNEVVDNMFIANCSDILEKYDMSELLNQKIAMKDES